MSDFEYVIAKFYSLAIERSQMDVYYISIFQFQRLRIRPTLSLELTCRMEWADKNPEENSMPREQHLICFKH